MKNKVITPNIIRGGKAIPIGNNFYYIKGRKHTNGGVDVGKDLEVEGGEVMQMKPKEVKVYSSVKFLGGDSPADLVMKGANPNKVFKAQQDFKKINHINDDGTKKARLGIKKNYNNWLKELAKTWNTTTKDISNHDYDYEKYYNDNIEDAWKQLENVKDGVHFPDGGKSGTYKKITHPTYPDKGNKSWSNNDKVFHPSDRQMEDSDKILDYIGSDKKYFNGGAKVSYKGGEVLPTIYVLPNDKGFDLKRNKQNTGWIYKDRIEHYKLGGLSRSNNGTKKAGLGKKTNSKMIPSVDEFITSKIDSTRNAAYKKSIERTMPSVPKITNTDYDKEKADTFQKEYNNISSYLSKNPLFRTTEDYDKVLNSNLVYTLPNNINDSDLIKDLNNKEKGINYHGKKLCDGLSCIYTATDNYGKQYKTPSNIKFKNNPSKYGFKKIDKNNLKEGDIVQAVDYNGVPIHGMIYAGKDKKGTSVYNYSTGGNTSESIKHKAHFPTLTTNNYTFVGTPQDSVNWINEYKKKYNMKVGGRYILQTNKGTNVKFLPSTGVRKEAKFGFRGINRVNKVNKQYNTLEDIDSVKIEKPIKDKINTTAQNNTTIQDDNTSQNNKSKTNNILAKGIKITAPIGATGAYIAKKINDAEKGKSNFVSKSIDKYQTYKRNKTNIKLKNTKINNIANMFEEDTEFFDERLNNKPYEFKEEAKPVVTDSRTKAANEIDYTKKDNNTSSVKPKPTVKENNNTIPYKPKKTVSPFKYKAPWQFDTPTELSTGSNLPTRGSIKSETLITGFDGLTPEQQIIVNKRNLRKKHVNDRPLSREHIKPASELSEVEQRHLDKVYKKAVGNKPPRSGYEFKHEPTTISYEAPVHNEKTYDATAEINQIPAKRKATEKINTAKKQIGNLKTMRQFNKAFKGAGALGMFFDIIHQLFPSEDEEAVEKTRVNVDESNKRAMGKKQVYKMGGRNKAQWGIHQYRPSIFGVKNDRVINITPKGIKRRDLYYSDPDRPEMSYADLLKEGYFTNTTTLTPYGERMEYIPKGDVKDKSDTTKNKTKKVTKRYAAKNPVGKVTRNNKVTPNIKINTGIKNPVGKVKYNRNLTNTSAINNPITLKRQSTKPSRIKMLKYRFKNRFKDKDNLNDIIGTTSNIAGAASSYLINNGMLNDLTPYPQPALKKAAKLNTTENINASLDTVREGIKSYERDIDSNTSNSRAGLARKQIARLSGISSASGLYQHKYNTERDLVNRSNLNYQNVANQNVDAYNQWQDRNTAFKNTVREKKSENAIDLVNNVNRAFQDSITKKEKRNAHNQNLLAFAASHPNVTPELLESYGIKLPKIRR